MSSTKVKEMFILDADGVITSLETRSIERKELLNFIIEILGKNEPVAINTGSTIKWVKERIFSLIYEELHDKKLLRNLFASVEKGGAWIEFDDYGQELIQIDKSINIPEKIKNRIREMVKAKFSGRLFYDEDKLTMITVEKERSLSIEEFNRIHPELDAEIEKILKEEEPEGRLKFVPTTLDTDIENKSVGKDLGARRILDWLRRKEIDPESFIAIGDSISDLEMARHLTERGIHIKFVFVGTSEINPSDYNFPLIITTAKYDEGTLEYLLSNYLL